MLLKCPTCHESFSSGKVRAGRTVHCPECHEAVTVPYEPEEDAEDRPRAPQPPPPPQNAFDFGSNSRTENEDENEDEDEARRRRQSRKQAEEPPKWLLAAAMAPIPLLVILGGLIGGVCGGVAAGLNAIVARQRGMSVAVKLVLFAGTTLVAFVCNIILVMFVLVAIKGVPGGPAPVEVKPPGQQPFQPGPAPVPDRSAPPKEWNTPPITFPNSPQLPAGTAPEKFKINTEINFLMTQVHLRLPNGPAEATAGHAYGDLMVIGYADGSTAIWNIRKPVTDSPLAGPKFPGPIDRVWIAGKDSYIIAETAGRLRVATLQAPHRGVVVPEGRAGLRSAFGTAAIIRETPDGYEARWLVDAGSERGTAMPPRRFGDLYNEGVKSYAAPPVKPDSLLWIHSTPAAILPDGRICHWNDQGRPLTRKAHPKPIAAFGIAMPQVEITTVDQDGTIQIRQRPDFTVERQFQADGPPPVRILSTADGQWTLGADATGSATVWEVERGKAKVIYQTTAPTAVRPLAVTDGAFAVGIGPAVEMWNPHLLKREMKK